MATNVIAAWVFLLGLVAAEITIGFSSRFLTHIPNIATILLVFKCLPVSVFESSGFGRVSKWNKVVFGLLAAASLFFVFLLILRP